MKHFYSLLTALLLVVIAQSATAQVVTTQPPIVQIDSKNIVITFHADRGNRGLAGFGKSTKIYAHTGVITDKSNGSWVSAPTWGDNSPKYELTWVANNTWTLTIPSIDSYYNVPAGETVTKLAFVFRTADNSSEGKDTGGSDIFVNVQPAGFSMDITADSESMAITDDKPVKFTVNTTNPADIALYIGSTDTTPFASTTSATQLEGTTSFPTAGAYNVIAVANYGGTTYTKTLTVVRLAEDRRMDYPGGVPKMGTHVNSDGSVTFCLAAPDKKSAIIVGSWNDYEISPEYQMYYQDYEGSRYFWIPLPGLDPNTDYIYYYLIDGSVKVGDPYARLILDPYNDKYISPDVFPNLPAYPTDKVQNVPLAIYNMSADNYDWEIKEFNGPAQSDLLIYELLIRDFTGTNNESNGEGTVNGVISKLDYLTELGINAIELLPIMEFNGNNSWGYNTNFYFAPDKAYGTPSDYRRLIDECHKRGIAVILDIVLNQSDGLHPWYQMYDIAKNPFYNGSAPHAYSVLNDWNQDNPVVQQQWRDVLAYWLEAYKVDGFRFDLVKGLGNNNSYGNTYYPATNTWGTPSDSKTNDFNQSRVDRMRSLHQAMRQVKENAYFINENLAGAKEENMMAEDGEINWANINYAACQFAMGYQSGSNLNRFYAPDDSRLWGSTVSYSESHDEERMMAAINANGASGIKNNVKTATRRCGSAAAQMLMAPGAHMIWQFQELGASQSTKNNDGSNNTSPKKVIWNNLNNTFYKGLMTSYQELFWIRRKNPELFRQEGVTVNINCNDNDWSTGRFITLSHENRQLCLVVNPNTARATFNVPVSGSDANYFVISKSADTDPVLTGGRVTLEAGAYVIFATNGLTGIESIEADGDNGAISVYGGNGEIIINGDYNSAEVYTTTGVKTRMDSLVRGIYIVVVDGSTYKVAVR